MLEFDAETARILDNAYQGADLTRRRQASFDALGPCPGDTILDIGCGNGLLTQELARAVGNEGRVIGIDPSKDMRNAGVNRCRDYKCVEFIDGTANKLPVGDGFADKAVSVQVFEYIDDIEGAALEAMRTLKPNGRLVISDLHYGSFVWSSDDPIRMARMRASFDQHIASGDVPERLPGMLKNMGFEIEVVKPVTLTDTILKPDGIAIMVMHLMKRYAISNQHVETDVVQEWFAEQQRLAQEGRFFFSITQFVIVARKLG